MGIMNRLFGRAEPTAITVVKSADPTPAKIMRIVRRGEPAGATVRKGDVLDLDAHRPAPFTPDATSTDFFEVLAAKTLEDAEKFRPMLESLRSGKFTKVSKAARSPTPVVTKKAARGAAAGVRLGTIRGQDQVRDATAEIIQAATDQAVDQILEKVNAAISGVANVQKAEPTHDEIVQSRRNELAEIDAEILMGTSGLLETALPEPSRLSKSDAADDAARHRRQMGIQEDIRKAPYEGAR